MTEKINEEDFLQILDSREERFKKQQSLNEEYKKTLISFTINAPGIQKDRDSYQNIHQVGYEDLLNVLHINNVKILYKEYLEKNTGNEAFILIDENAEKIKKLTTTIEDNHFLGRIFDIDIFDENMKQLSRTDLNLLPRKCLICQNNARVCIREKNHNYKELINTIDKLWDEYSG